MTLVITLVGGRLHVQPTGQETLRLAAESADKFFLRTVNAQISFTKGPSGAVTGLILHQGGRDQPARKVR